MNSMKNDYQSLTDLELVDLCRQTGDTVAFDVLMKRYEHQLYNYIQRMINSPSEAEELAQETFLRIYANLKNFRSNTSFSPWAYRIAHNICIDYLRSPRKRLFVSLEAESNQTNQSLEQRLQGSSKNPEKELYRKELAQHIARAVQELPEKLRSVFILYQYNHKSYEEIAQILEIPLGTVKSRMHSALTRLSHNLRFLTPKGIDPRSSNPKKTSTKTPPTPQSPPPQKK